MSVRTPFCLGTGNGGNRKLSGMARVAPLVFVLLWSTGYIGAKFGLPFAPLFTFLFTRLTLASVLLLALAMLLRTPFPTSTQWRHSFVAGLLLHVGYLGGVFVGINLGVPAGISAIIVNLQPVLLEPRRAAPRGDGHALAMGGIGTRGRRRDLSGAREVARGIGATRCRVGTRRVRRGAALEHARHD
ncbi:MAG: EamA family transporter [Pleurocapsa sp. SU_196_0]|nr:EamA family transporter [Pleurocapsa sp. SU_196_0]